MTLMTTLDKEIPFVADCRKGSNSQYDFGLFVADCIAARYLKSGDVLVMDNASVHVAMEVFTCICTTCNTLGIKVVVLPAYSPELNPVEYMLSFVTNSLRTRRNSKLTLLQNMAALLKTFTHEQVTRIYSKCIFNPKVG